MYNLSTARLLTDVQKKILAEFFSSPLTQSFFLTGGTALSAFYFGHRQSKDFDFFSSEFFDMDRIREFIQSIALNNDASYAEKISTQTYKEIYLDFPDGVSQRIDIVREQPVHFGEIAIVDGIRVDNLENIGANKINAIFGRLEPKDFIDLYFILHNSSWTFDALFERAKKKDMGLEPFMFSYSLSNASTIITWPKIIGSIKSDDIVRYFHVQAEQMLKSIQP